jgi:hypothetical protein
VTGRNPEILEFAPVAHSHRHGCYRTLAVGRELRGVRLQSRWTRRSINVWQRDSGRANDGMRIKRRHWITGIVLGALGGLCWLEPPLYAFQIIRLKLSDPQSQAQKAYQSGQPRFICVMGVGSSVPCADDYVWERPGRDRVECLPYTSDAIEGVLHRYLQDVSSQFACAFNTRMFELIRANTNPTPQSVTDAGEPTTELRGDALAPDLVLVGRVTDVKVNSLPAPATKHWIVTASVLEVRSGSFDGSSFAFRVHSPARAGLEIGKDYTFAAERTDAGYFVDEMSIKRWQGQASR